MRTRSFAFALALLAARPVAADPPLVEHQPAPCTVAEQPVSLCASISADTDVAKARIYFRETGAKFYSYVDMTFGGIQYCGTLPAPRQKAKAVEYYIQGTDTQYETRRTSTFQLGVQAEGVCEFPPVEKDAQKAAAITVFATSKKQGKKLSDAFLPAGVSFVPTTGG